MKEFNTIRVNRSMYIVAKPIIPKSCFGCDATMEDCTHPTNLTCLGGENFILVRDNEVGKTIYARNKILGGK